MLPIYWIFLMKKWQLWFVPLFLLVQFACFHNFTKCIWNRHFLIVNLTKITQNFFLIMHIFDHNFAKISVFFLIMSCHVLRVFKPTVKVLYKINYIIQKYNIKHVVLYVTLEEKLLRMWISKILLNTVEKIIHIIHFSSLKNHRIW